MPKAPIFRLTRLLIISVVVLLAGAAFAFAGQDQPQSKAAPAAANTAKSSATTDKPKISFPESSFDFGTVQRGSINEHVFKVRNIGIAPLMLIKAQAG